MLLVRILILISIPVYACTRGFSPIRRRRIPFQLCRCRTREQICDNDAREGARIIEMCSLSNPLPASSIPNVFLPFSFNSNIFYSITKNFITILLFMIFFFFSWILLESIMRTLMNDLGSME